MWYWWGCGSRSKVNISNKVVCKRLMRNRTSVAVYDLATMSVFLSLLDQVALGSS